MEAVTIAGVGHPDEDGALVRVGGEAAFADVYGEHHARLVRLAYLLTGSLLTAEDVTQEAFAKLHERFGRVANPGGWLRTVVLNGARNEVRRQVARRRLTERLRSRATVEQVDAPDPATSWPSAAAGAVLEARPPHGPHGRAPQPAPSSRWSSSPELMGALERLTARQRAVVVLRFYEDLAEAEIADALGIRLGTVKSSLHRALAALRSDLGSEEPS